MNHHVRNALQALEMAEHDLVDAETRLEMAKEARKRILECLVKVSRNEDLTGEEPARTYDPR